MLRTRKEKLVPDYLLHALKNDPHLEVRKYAKRSFASITGFTSRDIFALERLELWWNDNKEEVDETLKEMQTMESVIEEMSSEKMV